MRCLTTTLPAAMVNTKPTRDSKAPRALSMTDTIYAAMTAATIATTASMKAALTLQGCRDTKHVRPPATIPSTLATIMLIKTNTVAPFVPINAHLPYTSRRFSRSHCASSAALRGMEASTANAAVPKLNVELFAGVHCGKVCFCPLRAATVGALLNGDVLVCD